MIFNAFKLYKQHHSPDIALRSVCVAPAASRDENRQLSLFDGPTTRKQGLEQAIDGLRERFGSKIIVRGIMLTDPKLSAFDPGNHVIHPVSYFK